MTETRTFTVKHHASGYVAGDRLEITRLTGLGGTKTVTVATDEANTSNGHVFVTGGGTSYAIRAAERVVACHARHRYCQGACRHQSNPIDAAARERVAA